MMVVAKSSPEWPLTKEISLPASVSVTVGGDSSLQDAATTVRREFPTASLNEILRYCALAVTEGRRIAREMVFGKGNHDVLAKERVSVNFDDSERALLDRHIRSGLTLSEIIRLGLYTEAGESPAKARELARMPRGPKPRKETNDSA